MRKGFFLFLFFLPLLMNCEVSGDPEMLELMLEIKNQNEELLNEVKSLQVKSDSLINELKNSAAKHEELLEKVNSLQAELATILSQINALTEKLNSQDEDFESIKNQLADLQEKYQAILGQLEQLQKLSQVLAEIEILKGQLSELDGKYVVILNGLSQNQEELQALKNQIETLQAQLAENLSKISELTSQLGQQGANISEILNEISLLKDSCLELNTLLIELINNNAPKIGDYFGGGIVFYLDESNFHGLIVSSENVRDSGSAWGCYCVDIKNTKPDVGTGLNNTNEIINQCNSSGIAARLANDFVFEGFDDWYLPSKDELDLVYRNLHLKGIGNFSKEIPYWSSTQGSFGSCGIAGGAWTQNFGTGEQFPDYKLGYSTTGAVRAIRSF